MFLTVHAVAGELIAQSAAASVSEAFVLGFLSHFVVDSLPHGDEGIGDAIRPDRNPRLLILIGLVDLFLAGIVQVILFAGGILPFTPLFLAAAFGAMLPDAMQLPSIILRSNNGLFGLYRRAHESAHNLIGVRLGLPLGLMFQVLTLLLLIDALR